MKDRPLPSAAFLGLLLAALPGCPSGDGSAPQPAASTASARPAPAASAAPATSAVPATSADAQGVPVGIPASSAAVARAVNPRNETPYSGPSGTLKGKVRYEGDPPPDTDLKIPSKCNEAAASYGKLFRVGLDKALADVLVAVTEYKGFVPARETAAKITIHGCAFARRTMALTFGQHIEVSNLDQVDPYMPYLDGAPSKAMMVAVPNGLPVKLYPLEPGHYLLRDQLPNDFLRADVYVISYATHDVTGLDGQYEIKDIPVGRVKVSAFLPAIDRAVENVVEIKAGENTADFTLTYDKSGKGAAAAPAAASAAAGAKGGGKAPAGAK